MPGPWYSAALPEAGDAAWELYHENSKRGPGDGAIAAPEALRPFAYSGLPELTPVPADAPLPPAVAAGTILHLLAVGGRPLGGDDPVLVFVYAAAVAGLPAALAIHDPTGPYLRLLVEDVAPAEVAAARAPGTLDAAAAVVFLATELDAATAVAGERGYRNALVAVGRHLAALEAAAPAGVTVRPVEINDRVADALLYLDGLSRSVIAAVAIAGTGG